jgi:urease accessory protein
MSRRPALSLVLLLLGLGAGPVHAHDGHGMADGFLAGVLHPVTGLDHLLAMVAVGIWGAFLGRPLIWQLPVAFPLVVLIGGVLGIAGVSLPFVEAGIALSVVVLGAAIALRWSAPTVVAVAIIAVFAIFHGHAHGTELPQAAAPQSHAAGFVLATGLLHLAGVALGLLVGVRGGAPLLRGAGAAIALVGGGILLGQSELL